MELTLLADGFAFLEAPRIASDGTIYFSDVIDGGIYRYLPNGEVESHLPGRRWIGGMAINYDGAVVVSGEGGLIYYNPDTRYQAPLLPELDGMPIGSIGDIQPSHDGGLYGGVVDAPNLIAGLPPRPSPLFHLSPEGVSRVVWKGIFASNGLGWSPDGKRLYHAESYRGIWLYDIAEDGSLSNQRMFAELTDCDGLAIDAAGGVWVASPHASEVVMLSPESGAVTARIETPGRLAMSIAFGGSDLRDLYIVTAGIDFAKGERGGALFRCRVPVSGLATPLTRFTPPRDTR